LQVACWQQGCLLTLLCGLLLLLLQLLLLLLLLLLLRNPTPSYPAFC
jgi:hypothetical protein